MPRTAPSGSDRATERFRARIASIDARTALDVAEDHAKHMDAADSDLQSLAYVMIHCTRAILLTLTATPPGKAS